MREFLKQYWNALLGLGLFLSVAGLSAGAVSGVWVPIPLVLVIVGLVILGVWLIYQGQFSRGFWTSRSTETGTNAIFATVSVLLILGIVNFLAVRTSARLDLTETKRFTLAPQTQEIVRNLEEPVKVWVFSNQPSGIDSGLLKNYQRLNPNYFEFEYVDPQTNPGLVREFNVGQIGDVYLEAGEQRQYVQTVGVEPLTEAKLTNRLAQLSGGDRLTVYFLQGHGEPPLVPGAEGSVLKAVRALEDQNASVESIELLQEGKIPDDADVVVIAGPEQPLFDREIQALQDYLDNGGGVLVLLDPNTNPGLDDFLEDWGVTLDDRIAIDPERWVQGFGPAAPLVVDYGTHPITEDFGRNYSLFPVVRSIEYDEVEGITVSPLLFTSNASWAEKNLEEGPDWTLNPDEDKPGPLVLAVALSQPVETPEPTPSPEAEATEENTEEANPEAEATENETEDENAEAEVSEENTETTTDEAIAEETEANVEEETDAEIAEETEENAEAEAEEPETEAEENTETETPEEEEAENEARLVVVGDSDFMTDSFFDGQLNSDFFLNSIQWLSQGTEETLSIRPREDVDRNIVMTPQQARLLGWTALVTFPIVGFAASAILWWTRR
ncbi:MAG: Gldg family protein [Cyanobacteria bacterium SBC]|nr:Gldg family protein [Cyanobacteria bacterium SBC]